MIMYSILKLSELLLEITYNWVLHVKFCCFLDNYILNVYTPKIGTMGSNMQEHVHKSYTFLKWVYIDTIYIQWHFPLHKLAGKTQFAP